MGAEEEAINAETIRQSLNDVHWTRLFRNFFMSCLHAGLIETREGPYAAITGDV